MQNPRAKPQCKGRPGLWGAPCCTLPSFSAACPKPLVPNPSMTPCAKFSCTHVTPDSRANPRAKKPSCKRSAGIHTAADASSAEGQGHNSACSPPRAKEKPHKNLVQKNPSCKRAPRAKEPLVHKNSPGVARRSWYLGTWGSTLCSITHMVSENRPARKP